MLPGERKQNFFDGGGGSKKKLFRYIMSIWSKASSYAKQGSLSSNFFVLADIYVLC